MTRIKVKKWKAVPALQVRCPHCGAGEGARCVTFMNAPRSPHKKRKHYAKRGWC